LTLDDRALKRTMEILVRGPQDSQEANDGPALSVVFDQYKAERLRLRVRCPRELRGGVTGLLRLLLLSNTSTPSAVGLNGALLSLRCGVVASADEAGPGADDLLRFEE